MACILGVDPSLTSTGWAWADLDTGEIRCETIRTKPSPGVDVYADWYARIELITGEAELCRRTAGKHISLAVIEGPSYHSTGKGFYARAWLWGRLYGNLINASYRVLVVPPALRMMYATGRGNAHKDTVLAAAIKRFPGTDIGNNDEADAVILAAIGARYLGHPIDTVPTSHHSRVMPKLALIDRVYYTDGDDEEGYERPIKDVHLPELPYEAS